MRQMITHLDWTVQIHVGDVLAPHWRVWQGLVECQDRSRDCRGYTYWHEHSTWSLDILNLRDIEPGLRMSLWHWKQVWDIGLSRRCMATHHISWSNRGNFESRWSGENRWCNLCHEVEWAAGAAAPLWPLAQVSVVSWWGMRPRRCISQCSMCLSGGGRHLMIEMVGV